MKLRDLPQHMASRDAPFRHAGLTMGKAVQRRTAERWTSTPATTALGTDWDRHTSCCTCHTTPCSTSDGESRKHERALLLVIFSGAESQPLFSDASIVRLFGRHAVQRTCGLSTPACGAQWANATKMSSSQWTRPPSVATAALLSTRTGRA